MQDTLADQNPKYNSKLFYRVLSYLVPTVVIAFLSIWLVSSSTIETQIRERVTRGLKLSATGLATTLDATLNDMLSDAATTSRLYLPQEAIESGDPKNFQWYADELVSKKNRYLAIVVSDSNGKVIGTNTVNQEGEPGFAKNLGRDLSKEAWFQSIPQTDKSEAFILAQERPTMFLPVLDENEYVTGVIYPVFDILDEPIGLISFFISHKHFGKLLDQFTITHRGVVESLALLSTADGKILAHPASLSGEQPWNSIDSLTTPPSGQWRAPNQLNFFMNESALQTQANWPWRIITLKLDTIVNAPITAVSQKLIILFFFTLMVTLVIIFWIVHQLIKPIEELTLSISTMKRAADFKPLKVTRSDEIGKLTHSFNTMTSTVADYEEHLERFVPKKSLALLGTQSVLEVELGQQAEKELAVLFLDIRGFTALVENMTPADTFSLLNSFLKAIGPVVSKHNGIIDKYLGDGLLAYFYRDDSSCDDAIACSIEMMQKLEEYNQTNREGSIPGFRTDGRKREALQVGIGVHSGKVVFGTIGHEDRVDFTILGDTVNTTSRIETLTKNLGASLIVHESVIQKSKSKYANRYIGAVQVKGKTDPLRLWEVFSESDPALRQKKQDSIADFSKALEYFEANKKLEAYELFEAVVKKNADDKVAQYYMDWCNVNRAPHTYDRKGDV